MKNIKNENTIINNYHALHTQTPLTQTPENDDEEHFNYRWPN